MRSFTDFPIGPTDDRIVEWTCPCLGPGPSLPMSLTLLFDGLNPHTPLKIAGNLIEPPISVEIERLTELDAIKAPSPPELPPVVLVLS